MNHEEWLANKRYYIGGSEAASVMGIGYGSALAVYLDKIGEGTPIEDNEPMYWGRTLQSILVDEYTKRTGIPAKNNEYDVYYHIQYIGCTPDAIAECPLRGRGVLEIKTAGEYMLSHWADDSAPEHYIIQLYHNMLCCDVKWGALVALVGGNKFIIREFTWDDELITMLRNREIAFWNNHVLPRIPPDPTGASLDVLSRLYPADNGELVPITNGIGKDIVNYTIVKERLKELESQEAELKARIQGVMGEAQKGIYQHDDGSIYAVSWSTVAGRVSLDQRALEAEQPEIYQRYCKTGSSYRRFTVAQKKGKLTAQERALIGG